MELDRDFCQTDYRLVLVRGSPMKGKGGNGGGLSGGGGGERGRSGVNFTTEHTLSWLIFLLLAGQWYIRHPYSYTPTIIAISISMCS